MDKKLYLVAQSSTQGGEHQKDGMYRNPSYISVTFKSVVRESPGFFAYDFDVSEEVYSSERVFLVIPRYQDGNSFGTTHGNWDVWAAVATEDEALKIRESILSDDHTDDYRPWKGYFASLEGVEIHCFRIGRTSDVQYH